MNMEHWPDADDGHADISSHDAFLDGPPYRTFERLRREDPVAWCDEADGRGFWAITRHEDIGTIGKDYKTFSSAKGIRIEDMAPDELVARRTLMEMDPPEHTNIRLLVNRGFTRRVIEKIEPRIQTLAAEVVGAAIAKPEFDFVTEIAKTLPIRMLGRLLGTPEEDDEWLVNKGDELIANTDPDFTDHVVDQTDTEAYRLLPFRSPAGQELFDYGARQAEIRRERGGDDVICALLQPTREGQPLSDLEFMNFFALLVSAGNDTTRYSIASSMHLLANHPELYKTLQTADDAVWNSAVEELLRWASPTMHFRRTATQETEIHGKTIKAGDKVLLWFVSANRDDSVFDDPYNVNFRRHPNNHLAFGGGGPHTCLGMWLARLELRAVLREFIKHVESVHQAGPHSYLRSNFIKGIKKLPLAIERR